MPQTPLKNIALGLSAIAALALFAAPLSASAEESAEEPEKSKKEFSAEGDPRLGEEVTNLCFTRSINGFKRYDKDALILRRSVKDRYLVTFSGICSNLRSVQAVKLASRSSCLSRGDTILVSDSAFFTDNTGFGVERCTIKRIYNWNEDAVDEETAEEAETEAENTEQ
jgi:uncharacterized protein DUF6491